MAQALLPGVADCARRDRHTLLASLEVRRFSFVSVVYVGSPRPVLARGSRFATGAHRRMPEALDAVVVQQGLSASEAGHDDPADVVDAVAEARAVLVAATDTSGDLALSDECLVEVPVGSPAAVVAGTLGTAAADLGTLPARRIAGPAEVARQPLAASYLAKPSVV